MEDCLRPEIPKPTPVSGDPEPLLLRRPRGSDGLASAPGPGRPGAEAPDGANPHLETAPRSWKRVSGSSGIVLGAVH